MATSTSQREIHPLDVLEHYATLPDADMKDVVGGLMHSFDATTLTIQDAYPKAKYHLLVLPRPHDGIQTKYLRNLKVLFAGDKARAKAVLEDLGRAAEKAKESIEQDMLERWKFKWDVWMGFHAIPSMRHIHMHVISADLVSKSLKNKKHYNTFHPKLGFFLHYKDVMEWFEAVPSYWERMIQFKPSTYEPLLKEDLVCFHCHREMRNIPVLKDHLEREFDEMKERGRERERNRKAALEKKRKREEERAAKAEAEKTSAETSPEAFQSQSQSQPFATEDDAPPTKKQETQSDNVH
ncbi:hypothetical protein EIP86_002320 [Pleurotus ostreatoroseus]|nr:hypothetical protein EIP86_002320 [Pleurotus ostreatoroseus]